MKAASIAGVRPRKRNTTIRVEGITPACDLVERQFTPDSPNVLWVADITYLRPREGWLYLAAVQDAYSGQIVGWSMATDLRATLVEAVLVGRDNSVHSLPRRRRRPSNQPRNGTGSSWSSR